MSYYYNVNRPHHIRVNLNDKEYSNLKTISECTGMSREAVLREMIEHMKIKPNPPADYPSIVRELTGIGNRMNEIAATIHTHGFVDVPKLKATLEDLHKLEAVFNNVFAPEESGAAR